MPKRLIDSVIYEITDDGYVMHFNDGRSAVIDAIAYPVVSQHRWRMDAENYVVATKYGPHGTSKGVIALGRLILGLTNCHTYADHIDGDVTDNRRLNLREATASQNQQNRKTCKRQKDYKGLYREPNGRFRASICLGTFDTAEKAAQAYDRAAVWLRGPFARTNFRQSAAELPVAR